jgi:hypothetical protein
MMIQRSTFVCLLLLLGACSDSSDRHTVDPPQPSITCAEAAPGALEVCFSEISAAAADCYATGGSACAADDPAFTRTLNQLASDVEAACDDGDVLSLGAAALAERLQYACQSNADSLAWRTFGGPQGAVWEKAGESDKTCLLDAHEATANFAAESLGVINTCLDADDCTDTASERERLLEDAVGEVAAACPDLPDLNALSPETFVARAADQVDCLTATAHESTGDLALTCGPAFAEPLPPRGEWTQLILDEEKWGSRCGDGTDYAIQIRPAPEGSPLDRVMIGLQGGGVCIFEQDCRSRLDSGLFNAQDDGPPVFDDPESPFSGGILGQTPDNPFADWTLVYLPYCDQAVFTGGGYTEQFSDFVVHRFGSLNLRAGVRAARDILWSMLDAEAVEGGSGYRPDKLIAMFGGFSAGAYGTIYNYHYMLDDLLWPRTTAFPDSGGALDNGGVGVRTLGDVKIPQWQVLEYLPPYCFTGNCSVGPEIYRAIAPRLKQVPEQQMLIMSNQKDLTQQGDAFFSEEDHWINSIRQAYCDTKDLNGIHWYLTSDSVNSVHVVSIRDEFYYGEVAGERMVDWLWRAVTDPDTVGDYAEEGNFVEDIPGALPFPCELP